VLLAGAIDLATAAGAASLELRHVVRRFDRLQPKTHKVAMRLALHESSDAQWQALDRKLRNQVRKADKSGLTIDVGGDDLLDAFYDVFAENMRDLGTPVYDFRFFLAILRTFPDTARVFVVRRGAQPIAASIVYRYGSMMEVPWASSLRAFNHLCANVRLYWAMLEHAIATQCTVFDFGRSTPNEGTYAFKKQWGATALPLVWEYWLRDGKAMPDLSPKNAKFSLAIQAWQSLPVAVSRVLGPPIVRHIP
jgi:FemAB-related protein (PEP-CTERM system-associated)